MKTRLLIGILIIFMGCLYGGDRYMILDDLRHIADPKTPPSINTWSKHRKYVNIASYNIYSSTKPLDTTQYGVHFRPNPPTDILSKWQIRTMDNSSGHKSILYCEIIKSYRDKVFAEEGKIEDIIKIKCIDDVIKVTIVFGKDAGIINIKIEDDK